MSKSKKAASPASRPSRCYADDVQIEEWWAVEKDGFVLKWSPRELWLRCGDKTTVICEWPTYGDVRNAIRGLGWQLPPHWSA
jgi:hypothetical protein